MENNWAIIIGINDYDHHPEQQLSYAVRDAELMRNFLCNTAQFPTEQVILCPGVKAKQGTLSYPNCANLLRLLNRELHPDRLGQVDRFWFFFSGHGISKNGRDYLITSDCLEEETERFALPIDQIIAALRLHKQADIVLILDACRQKVGSKNIDKSIGQQTLEVARERGITSIFSCSYGERSYEIDAIQHGSFTYALVEGLKQNTLPVELEQYLRRRVQQLNQKHNKPVSQTPIIQAESASRMLRSLLSECATDADVRVLISCATDAELKENFDLAEELWWQINQVSNSWQARRKVEESIKRIYARSHSILSRPTQSSINEVQSESSHKEQEFAGGNANQPPKVQPAYRTERLRPESLQKPKDDLSSEKGVNYTHLRDLLQAGNWKEADQETYRLMMQAVNKHEGEWLTSTEAMDFPCKDLRTIDRLWVKYSRAQFGFSVQGKIYSECIGRPGKKRAKSNENDVWEAFSECVGWPIKNLWSSYDSLTFDTSAPRGHLPCHVFIFMESLSGVTTPIGTITLRIGSCST